MQHWLAENRIKTIYIEPGSPWQNGFVESLHGRFRGECLNREQLWPLSEARVVIEDFRRQYNTQRPHSKLGYLSPARYAARLPHPWLRSGFALPSPRMDNTLPIAQAQPIQTESTPGPQRRVRSAALNIE